MTLPAFPRQSLFIAGTDTGVGKTWVAVRLLHALGGEGLRTAAMKPVAAGADLHDGGLRNADALELMAAATVPAPYELVNPCCFPAATSPHLAAARDGRRVDLEAIKQAFSRIRANSDVIIVEGAGGWLAPIADPAVPGDAGPTMEDVALALGLPVLLVVGLKLGCISHALLTADAVRRAGLPLAGWIANPVDPAFSDQSGYLQSLQLRLPAPQWVIPELPAG
jgi:dethiobiotin synthetase